jgi:isopenicillin N synthase-like dioxygenase
VYPTRDKNSMMDIPVVDFAKAANGTREEKEQVATSIDNAFRNVGFVYLKNHGVPLNMVNECFDWVCYHRL